MTRLIKYSFVPTYGAGTIEYLYVKKKKKLAFIPPIIYKNEFKMDHKSKCKT